MLYAEIEYIFCYVNCKVYQQVHNDATTNGSAVLF